MGDGFAAGTQLVDGASEIDGVPEDDGGEREIEAGGAVALILESPIADFLFRAGIQDIEPSIGEITNARREAEAQEAAQAEHAVDGAGGVGVVLAKVLSQNLFMDATSV